MEIRQSMVGEVAVLNPVGKLLLSEGESDTLLRDTVADLMTHGRRQFVVNLADVSQVDTAGITALVAMQIAVQKRGGGIKLLNPPKRLREVLAITKLNTYFDVFDTERDAIASLTRESGSPT